MKETKLELNSRVITFDNKRKRRDLEAVYAEGIIVKIYTLVFHTNKHKYQYRIKLDSGKYISRYFKDIFENKEDCIEIINKINRNREVMRKARKELV